MLGEFSKFCKLYVCVMSPQSNVSCSVLNGFMANSGRVQLQLMCAFRCSLEPRV
jgi:hypothetical protein